MALIRGHGFGHGGELWTSLVVKEKKLSATDQAVTGVAGRYASALFDLARESKSVDSLAKDLSAFQSSLAGSADMQRLVSSPVFSAEVQDSALVSLAKSAKFSGIALNFLRTLCANRRLGIVDDVIRGFHGLVAADRGEAVADVTSAEKLSPKQISDLKAALEDTLGQNVQISTRVDPSLLGGLIVKVGSRMVDNSLKTKLQNLKVAMKGTG
jgi:F-type H+-transporting ATPase subunit delta